MFTQEWDDLTLVSETRRDLPVVTIPLILYSDDTSGNRSKKWNRFDVWALMLAGLPRAENAKLHNIHFMTASNQVNALELFEPISDDLLKLERGIIMHDSFLQKEVLVVAPVICIVSDNVRSSELLNHNCTNAKKYCRVCQVKRDSVHKSLLVISQ